MNENKIKCSFEYLDTDKDLDLRVIAGARKQLCEQSVPNGNRRKYGRFAIAMVLIICIAAAFEIPQVSSYAQSVLKKAGSYINIFNIEGASEEVKMEGSYVQIKSDASRDIEYFDTLSDIEEELGVQLLKYDKGTEGENAWNYGPSVNGDGKIFEIYLRNASYVLGDLEDVNLVGGTVEGRLIGGGYKAGYKKGKEFKTPVIGSITIRTEKNPEEAGKYKFPRDASYSRDIESDANAQKVYCENLGIDVILAYNQSDGLEAWGDRDIERMTCMYFIYEGIEYSFSGDVSYDAMLEIAEKLHY